MRDIRLGETRRRGNKHIWPSKLMPSPLTDDIDYAIVGALKVLLIDSAAAAKKAGE